MNRTISIIGIFALVILAEVSLFWVDDSFTRALLLGISIFGILKIGILIPRFRRKVPEKIETRTAVGLLEVLGVRSFTQRHIDTINRFIDLGMDEEEDVIELLNILGEWDEDDLRKAITYLLPPKNVKK